MSLFLVVTWLCILSTWMLWVFYLAVMNLKRAKEAGQLSRTALIFGTPVLWVGYVLDPYDPSGDHV